MLGVFGILAASCEKDLEPALPQENPQGPIVSVNDVVSVPAGVLAGDSHSLDLNNYNTPNAQILIMGPAETVNLPEGSVITYKIEFSNTDSFEKSRTIDAPKGETSETENNYYVSAEQWNDAHLYLFGKSPKVKQMHYRVYAYLNLEESDYLIGDKENPYVASGVIDETCIDSGFVIEDAYYFLSNATTWQLTEAAPFKFYHNPEVSPYDDPVFTYVFNLSQEVLDTNGGGCWWKIAPQSALDSNSEDTVLGPEIDGDTASEGMLTADNPGAGKITEAGRYEVTINMETMAYTVKLLANVIYVVGQPNGWNIDNDALYLSETAKESNIYSGVLKVDAGQFMFRFYSQLGDWGKGSIGSQNADASLDIAFTDGIYEGDIYQGGVNCTEGKGNWNVPDWEGGAVEITLDLNANKIKMTKASVNSGIYIRGDLNSWNAEDAYEFILTDKVSTWEIADVSISAGTQFKVADANWGDVNLGAGADPIVTAGVACPLAQGSNDNLQMGADFTGKAVLKKSGDSYTLTLEIK